MKLSIKIFLLLIFVTQIINAQSSNSKAPNFKLEDINSKTIELNELIGKGPVVICFWATWCKPCVDELNEYKKLYEEIDNKTITFVAVSIDDERSMSKVEPFVKRNKLPFITLFDSNKDVARKFSVQSVPYTFVLDKDGKIVYNHSGYKKGDEIKIKEKLIELLKLGNND